jgi:hypothetical protein
MDARTTGWAHRYALAGRSCIEPLENDALATPARLTGRRRRQGATRGPPPTDSRAHRDGRMVT